MNEPAIRVESLSKRYIIGKRLESYTTLRETLVSFIKTPLHRICHPGTASTNVEEFWALKEVSFDVRPGEVVGIIGRNGAGKTTLLKILSRITEPTKGCAKIRGRVGSLLEVGTGFHPELTGRENIYMNGAILGMKRNEIVKKLDEIVEFAEISKFLDTPVKRYSSGMYVRLAFAVAAHLEPEILLVDEVLAVGDVEFQKRCLGKMGDIARGGRTVLFISHNMTAISRLCPRAILLRQGELVVDGDSSKVIDEYLQTGKGVTSIQEWTDRRIAPGDESVRLLAVRAWNGGQTSEEVDIRKPVEIEMTYDILESGLTVKPYFTLWNEEGVSIFATIENDSNRSESPRAIGKYSSSVKIPGNFLAEGRFMVTAGMTSNGYMRQHFDVTEAIAFRVVDTLVGDSARGTYGGPYPGVVRPKLPWKTNVYQAETNLK